MNLGTFIFVSRSGGGKGTQAELLSEYIKANDPEKREIFYLESGSEIREFAHKEGYSNSLVKKVIDDGGLLPEFVSAYMWGGEFMNNLLPNNHIIIDGAPRRAEEVPIMDSAFKFYGRENPQIILINVSRDWSRARLKERGREDDKEESDIKNRLDWFDSEVIPMLERFKNIKRYLFHEINGEQTIKEVHSEIISKIKLS